MERLICPHLTAPAPRRRLHGSHFYRDDEQVFMISGVVRQLSIHLSLRSGLGGWLVDSSFTMTRLRADRRVPEAALYTFNLRSLHGRQLAQEIEDSTRYIPSTPSPPRSLQYTMAQTQSLQFKSPSFSSTTLPSSRIPIPVPDSGSQTRHPFLLF